jgi:hypothetical protein
VRKYPDGPPPKPKSSSKGFATPMARDEEPRLMPEFSTAGSNTSGWGSAYSSGVDQSIRYATPYGSEYTTTSNPTSTDAAFPGQQQYGYEGQGNSNLEERPIERKR